MTVVARENRETIRNTPLDRQWIYRKTLLSARPPCYSDRLKFLSRRSLAPDLVLFLLVASLLASAIPFASAQNQYIVATPGYINLGMTTTISVTAPAAGTYSVVVQQPSGVKNNLNFTATASGQVINDTYGNSSQGFSTAVNQVGTYGVFLEQHGQVVSATSFYTTNKLIVTMDMVQAGLCTFTQEITRGMQFIPRFYVHYASNGALMTNNTKGASINFTTPSGQEENAPWDSFAKLFDNAVSPNWNYTYVGDWSPSVTASDAYGNTGTYTYTGSPYVIAPADLSTKITFASTSTGQALTSIANGEEVTIVANITYPTNAEPTPGFVGPLGPSRGGAVTAQVGWGFYNVSTGTFGGGKSSGALIGTVLMTYSASNSTWTGQFESNSLPALPAGASYEVAVSSRDSASPANTGFAIANLAPAITATSSTLTQTTTQSVVQTVQTIPTVVYAAFIILLILGLLIGYIVRVPRTQS